MTIKEGYIYPRTKKKPSTLLHTIYCDLSTSIHMLILIINRNIHLMNYTYFLLTIFSSFDVYYEYAEETLIHVNFATQTLKSNP